MIGLLLVITTLVALPLLFPKIVFHWLVSFQTWLDERREREESECARLETLCQAHSEWANQMAELRHVLVRAVGLTDRSHITQALAAGQRYLKTIDQQEFPGLYASTEGLCQRLQQQLVVDQRSTKKGPG